MFGFGQLIDILKKNPKKNLPLKKQKKKFKPLKFLIHLH